MTVEPHAHAVVVQGRCPQCGRKGFHIVTVPKLATGELYPQFGHCRRCGEVDLKDSPPIPPDLAA